MYFEVRTKRLTVTEQNAYKTVKELWLFEVETYTEAEARVVEFMNKQFKGEDFSISKIQPSKIQRLEKTEECNPDDPYYKVKIVFLSENNKKKVTKDKYFILVRAENPEAVIVVANKIGNAGVLNYEVAKVEKTKFTGAVVMGKKSTTTVDKKLAEEASNKETDKAKGETKVPAKNKKK